MTRCHRSALRGMLRCILLLTIAVNSADARDKALSARQTQAAQGQRGPFSQSTRSTPGSNAARYPRRRSRHGWDTMRLRVGQPTLTSGPLRRPQSRWWRRAGSRSLDLRSQHGQVDAHGAQHFAAGSCCNKQNVYDPTSGRYIRFPKFSGSHGWQWWREIYLNDSSVWTYDLGENRWRNMRPLPNIPIPLRANDTEVVLELQPLIDDCYQDGRYRIDYAKSPVPPLSLEEAECVIAGTKRSLRIGTWIETSPSSHTLHQEPLAKALVQCDVVTFVKMSRLPLDARSGTA